MQREGWNARLRNFIIAALVLVPFTAAFGDFTAKFDVIKDGKVIDTMKAAQPSPSKEACEAKLKTDEPVVKKYVEGVVGEHELKGRCDENGQPV